MNKTIVAPSILSADFYNLEKEIHLVEESGAQWLHFDVMDGHFVPNISFGIPVLASINKKTNLVKDVHIMISDPLFYADKFLDAGADILTFHYEACENEDIVNKLINMIHKRGKKAGVSIKPGTDVKVLLPFLKKIDVVLIMSVEPGFGGQDFISSSLDKISFLSHEKITKNYTYLIEVDGGINEQTARLCKEQGVNVLVAGSYLFSHEDIKERIEGLANE